MLCGACPCARKVPLYDPTVSDLLCFALCDLQSDSWRKEVKNTLTMWLLDTRALNVLEVHHLRKPTHGSEKKILDFLALGEASEMTP